VLGVFGFVFCRLKKVSRFFEYREFGVGFDKIFPLGVRVGVIVSTLEMFRLFLWSSVGNI
jgi:hypothetical protein